MYKKTSSQASCLWKRRKELEDLPGSWLFLSYKKLSIFSSLLSDSFYSVCFVQWQTICENRFFHLCIRTRAQMLELMKIHASSIRKARQWHCDYSFCKRKNEGKKKKTIQLQDCFHRVSWNFVFDRKVSTRNCKPAIIVQVLADVRARRQLEEIREKKPMPELASSRLNLAFSDRLLHELSLSRLMLQDWRYCIFRQMKGSSRWQIPCPIQQSRRLPYHRSVTGAAPRVRPQRRGRSSRPRRCTNKQILHLRSDQLACYKSVLGRLQRLSHILCKKPIFNSQP